MTDEGTDRSTGDEDAVWGASDGGDAGRTVTDGGDDDRQAAGDDRPPTDAEAACFEAGIKFGSLYHQFAGAPVSPESAGSLEAAIAESIENQPHSASVAVDIDREAVAAAAGDAGYTELTGRLFEAEVVVDYDGLAVVARMATEDGYPLMRVESVGE